MSGLSDPPVSGASDLMRSLGLYVDGPARWGNPVAGRGPGVFVIELPGGLEDAPIDFAAVRRWVERVPGMLIDGEPATPAAVVQRLASFWLPGEPILYVGRSARTVGGRLAAINATPLGDARPSAAANWLKALAVQSELRVWWAETDAHEEFEDALLGAVAERVETPADQAAADGGPVLPFGNIATPAGERRTDGLSRTLLSEPAPPPAAKPKPSRARTSPRGSGQSAPARPRPARASKHQPPAAEPTYLSSEGLERLTAELEQLRVKVRPEVIARVKAARELGDLRENADYEYARKEQSFVEGRIQALEQMLKSTVVITPTDGADKARLGSTVIVESDGEAATYLLVGPTEADPAAGRISHVSPVGRALIGARAGDEVSVTLPVGTVRYQVIEIR